MPVECNLGLLYAAGAVEAFAGACCRVAQGGHPDDPAAALGAAAASFTALRLTAKQLGALLQLPSQPNEVRHKAAPLRLGWCTRS